MLTDPPTQHRPPSSAKSSPAPVLATRKQASTCAMSPTTVRSFSPIPPPFSHRTKYPLTPLNKVVVTSGPSSVWPRKAYRNPIEQLVSFLDRTHGSDWAVFEFRAEGTGYPDEKVYGRIHHFPWPDHHPPPFGVVPNVMAGMRNWIQGDDGGEEGEGGNRGKRVAVVHCKAGKGRSGTMSCAYLISEEGWKREEALERFTVRRMRAGFGQGVSIPSQLRTVRYVDRWANEMGKRYVERPVEVAEVHIWGLRDGVKVAVEGFVEEGKRIHSFHTFTRQEKTVVDEGHVATKQAPLEKETIRKDQEMIVSPVEGSSASSSGLSLPNKTFVGSVQTVVLRPKERLVVPTNDVNIDFERRNKASYAGFTMVTSVAHVWFNAWFEGGFEGHDSGVFEIEWDAMDGIKGSARKGVRGFDKLKVVWRYPEDQQGKDIKEPEKGEPVPEVEPADWKGEQPHEQAEEEAAPSGGLDSNRPGGAVLTVGAVLSEGTSQLGKELGLRRSDPGSANVSVASSVKDEPTTERVVKENEEKDPDSDDEAVKAHGPGGEDYVGHDAKSHAEGRHDTKTGEYLETGMGKVANIISRWRGDKKDDQAAQTSVAGSTVEAGADKKDFASPAVEEGSQTAGKSNASGGV